MLSIRFQITLPRFEARYKMTVNDTLKSLGIVDDFNPGAANFSKMSRASTFISDVLHEAVIKVDEEGTVMAACAAALSVPCCGRIMRNVKFTADHPFLYFGVDKNGTIIFMGTIVDDFQTE